MLAARETIGTVVVDVVLTDDGASVAGLSERDATLANSDGSLPFKREDERVWFVGRVEVDVVFELLLLSSKVEVDEAEWSLPDVPCGRNPLSECSG